MGHLKQVGALLTICMTAMFTTAVQAQDNACQNKDLLKRIVKQVNAGFEIDGIADCKVAPQQPNQIFIAYQNLIDGDENIQAYQLHILTADVAKKQLVQHYQDPEIYSSDAMQLESVRLDTANYQLRTHTRALGLRISYRGSSSVNPYHYTVLNLYDLSEKRKVLNKLRVDLSRGENDGRCFAENESRQSIIVVLPTKSQNWADLKVSTQQRNENFIEKNGECTALPTKRKNLQDILKYEGKTYFIPKHLREFEE